MKTTFKQNNILGSVYNGGSIVFSANNLISPIGNRLKLFNLTENNSKILDLHSSFNISHVAITNNNTLLLSVDVKGRCILLNLSSNLVIAHHSFKNPITAIKFSPNDLYFCISFGKQSQVWKTPGFSREFAPFQLLQTFTGHHDDITSLSWSPCSEYFITTSKDMTSRIFGVAKKDYIPIVLAGHRDTVLGAWFASDALDVVYSCSRDGVLIEWNRSVNGISFLI